MAYTCAFFALGLSFARLIPPLLPYDEIGHYLFAEILLNQRKMPYMQGSHSKGLPSAPEDEFHQAHQPPVYYAALAPAGAMLGGLKAHYQPDPDGLLRLRIATLLIFGGIYAWACWGLFGRMQLPYPLRPHVYGAALAVPTLVGAMATVTNDAGVIALSALALYFFANGGKGYWWGAAALGLAFGSKAFAMFLFPGLFLVEMAAIKREGVRSVLVRLAFMGLCLTALGGWWFLRNQALYGHPFATTMLKGEIIAASSMNPFSPRDVAKWCADFYRQFFDVGPFVRGRGNVSSGWWYVIACLPFSLVLISGWGLMAAKKEWLSQRTAACAVVAPVAGLAMIFMNSLDIYAPSGRYLLLAWPAVLLGFAALYERFPRQIPLVLLLFNGASLVSNLLLAGGPLWKLKNLVYPDVGWTFSHIFPF